MKQLFLINVSIKDTQGNQDTQDSPTLSNTAYMVCTLLMITPVVMLIRIERLLDVLRDNDKQRIISLSEKFVLQFSNANIGTFGIDEVEMFKDVFEEIMMLAMLDVFAIKKCLGLRKYVKNYVVVGKGIVSLLQNSCLEEDSLGSLSKLPFDVRYHLSTIMKMEYSM